MPQKVAAGAPSAPAASGRRGLPRPGTSSAAPAPEDERATAASTAPQSAAAQSPAAERSARTKSAPAKSATATSAPAAAEAKRYGRFTLKQWIGAGALIVVVVALLVFAAVMLARWLRTLEGVQGFLADYPGEYELPEGAPVGFPAWLGWQHFFNMFLMVLIIRSGIQIRYVKRPDAFWSPKWNPSRKISLSIWFHQALDILWLVNGVVFVVLLFATGQWLRIVPTSWDVFPNALSAMLQYASLNWPVENGWVNYNSLQQLAYFTTVFIAAPLAVLTGVRMSGLWPTKAKTLSKIYPIEAARALHFPVMLYFVAFIIVHIALVFSTGALRNLNHMYASQDIVNWTGFWIFVGSLVLIVASWIAARPLVIAPIAGLFGKVSSR